MIAKQHRFTSTIGIFQSAYQGSPVSSYMDVGLACCGEPIKSTYLWGFRKWADVNTNPDGSFASFGPVHSRRTPWFNQTDFNFVQDFKVNSHRENQVLGFEFNVLNLLNQHSITSYYEGMNSIYQGTPGLLQDQIFNGAAFYQGRRDWI